MVRQLELERFIEVLTLQAASRETQRQIDIGKEILNIYKRHCKVKLKVVFDEETSNFYITKGTAPSGHYYPCVVAHLDQVHYTKAWYKIFRDNDVLFAMGKTKDGDYVQVGTGSDDLSGVWMALELLIKQPYLKVAFFTDEEIGCIGSKKANNEFFSDCAFVMQADRRGNTKDFIIYTNGTQVSSKEFQQEVEPLLARYEYKTGNGSSTDVGQLVKNGIGICTVNLSCGYFYPHSDREISNIKDSFTCLDLMTDMANTMSRRRWEFTPPPPPVYTNTYDKYSGSGYNQGATPSWNDFEWERSWNKSQLPATTTNSSYNPNYKHQNRSSISSFNFNKDNFLLDISIVTNPTRLLMVREFLANKGYTMLQKGNKLRIDDEKLDTDFFVNTHVSFLNAPKNAIFLRTSNVIDSYSDKFHVLTLSSFYETYVYTPPETTEDEKIILDFYEDPRVCPKCFQDSLIKEDGYYVSCEDEQCDFKKVSVYNLNKYRLQSTLKVLTVNSLLTYFKIYK